MRVLLIQPPDPVMPVAPMESPAGDALAFSAPWSLLCLRSYLIEHTRHTCAFIDCRLYSNLEMELTEALKQNPDTQVAVVNTASLGLGQSAAVLEIIKRQAPAIITVACGQHPSQFPEAATSIPRADYALAGDPEPILRHFLDYYDVEQRRTRIPGLIAAGGEAREPYWLPDLRGLSLPDWDGVFWGAYRAAGVTGRAEARLSRGHTGLPADRAFGAGNEPLRLWPFARAGAAFERCGHQGITYVFLADPPGVWTPERLNEWCATLQRQQNMQIWGFQLLPTLLREDTLNLLDECGCRRVEFILPSCDPAVLRQYGCVIGPADFAATIARLEGLGISVRLRFWIGGPEERAGETDRIIRTVRALDFKPFSLHPFPLSLDAPLCQQMPDSQRMPIEDWIEWSRDPWTVERPVALWGGSEAVARVREQMAAVARAVNRSPQRLLKTFARSVFSTNWITVLEDKALSLLPRRSPENAQGRKL